MSDDSTGSSSHSAIRSGQFPPTQWTVVVKARNTEDKEEARRALETLCNSYWYPLYAFARRLGHAPHDAQDVTQSFFAYLLEKDLFAQADQSLGKLRSFLLTAFTRYCRRQRAKEQAQKRGGAQRILSIDADFDTGERRYRTEPADSVTPEDMFARTWAQSVLDAACENLERSERAAGRSKTFRVLQPCLDRGGHLDAGYEDLSAQLGLSSTALRQAISRLRRRYREAVWSQIASTLRDPTDEQVEQEMQALRRALGG